MKKTTLVASVLGLALVFGYTTRSEAFCFIFCDGSSGDSSSVEVEKSNVTDSAVVGGKGNQTLKDVNVSNSNLVNGNVSTHQSNATGAIGINKGDISQSNSAGFTGQTNLNNNDMRDMSINKGGGR